MATSEWKHSPANRTFERWILLGLGAIVFLIALSAELAYRNTTRLAEDARSVVLTLEVLDALGDMLNSTVDAETGERGYVITGLPNYLEPYHRAVSIIGRDLERVSGLIPEDSAQQARLSRLREGLAKKLAIMEEKIRLRDRAGFEEARRLMLTNRGKEAMDEIRAVVDEMKGEERRLLAENQDRSARSLDIAIATGLLTAALGLGIVVAFTFLLRSHLITKSKAATQLFHEKEGFRTTIASIADAVIVADPRGRVTLMNAVAQSLTGWPEGDAIGRPLDEIFRIRNEQTGEPVENPVAAILKGGGISGLPDGTILTGRDGRELPIGDSASPILDADGKIRGAVLVFRDVTEERRLERSLKEADARKDEFLATLAHELRNPLAPIRNSLYLMSLADDDRETIEMSRAVLERQVAHMVRLVDDLLDLSRITRNRIALRKEPVELADVLSAAVEASRPLAEAQGIDLKVSLPDAPILLFADQVRLAQVFSNLLNNAAKYNDRGGRIHLSATRTDREAVVTVEDDGEGIRAEMLPRIFDMFTQADRSLDRSQGGMGIGLALVRRLVEMHGGRVEAHSEGLGRGSRFVVRLPLIPDEAPAGDVAVPASARCRGDAGGSHRWRILVVDDYRDSTDSLARMLRVLGHDVRAVYHGSQAVEAAEAFRPDLAFIDISLPGFDGYQIAGQIRSCPWGKEMMLIALTGWGQDDDRRRSIEAGFDHHLVKPAEIESLSAILAN